MQKFLQRPQESSSPPISAHVWKGKSLFHSLVSEHAQKPLDRNFVVQFVINTSVFNCSDSLRLLSWFLVCNSLESRHNDYYWPCNMVSCSAPFPREVNAIRTKRHHMFIGPCIILIVEWIDQLMSLALFYAHVSNASTFIFSSLQLCLGILLCMDRDI